MGGIGALMDKLPTHLTKGAAAPPDQGDKDIRRQMAIINSMTHGERSRPEIIKASRRRRIAMGSGTSVTQVNQLLKQFGDMRKMMRNKGKMNQMMKQFGGGKRPF
jgi:signal recognition particle subunit SRP54